MYLFTTLLWMIVIIITVIVIIIIIARRFFAGCFGIGWFSCCGGSSSTRAGLQIFQPDFDQRIRCLLDASYRPDIAGTASYLRQIAKVDDVRETKVSFRDVDRFVSLEWTRKKKIVKEIVLKVYVIIFSIKNNSPLPKLPQSNIALPYRKCASRRCHRPIPI